MDNKHYFGLYLIRIKHSLVLFSLLLTALQSLGYLVLAVFSPRVEHRFSSVSFLTNLLFFY